MHCTNCVARIARRVSAPCTRVEAGASHQPLARTPCTDLLDALAGAAEASHQPPPQALVLVTPTEYASDEADDDCYNEVHWTTHPLTTHHGMGPRVCGPAYRIRSSTSHQLRSTIRLQGSLPRIHSKSGPHQLLAQTVQQVAQGRCSDVAVHRCF